MNGMIDLSCIEKPTMPVKINDVLVLDILPPSKNLLDQFIALRNAGNNAEIYEFTAKLMSVNKQKRTVCPADSGGDSEYELGTGAEKMIADYAHMNLCEIGCLCYYDWRVLLRDAVIHRAYQTDGGREWLKKCWLFEQTRPDRASLRKQCRKEGAAIGVE